MNDFFKWDRNDPQYFLGLWNEILLRVLQIMAAYIIATINNSNCLILLIAELHSFYFLQTRAQAKGGP